jgi:hypothetical protein
MNIYSIPMRANAACSTQRTFCRHLAIPTAAIIIVCSGIVAAHAGVVCFKDWGLHVGDTAFDRSSQTRLLAEKLAKGGDYVLVRDCITGQDGEDWFVYSSSPTFQSGFKEQTGQDVTKGLPSLKQEGSQYATIDVSNSELLESGARRPASPPTARPKSPL